MADLVSDYANVLALVNNILPGFMKHVPPKRTSQSGNNSESDYQSKIANAIKELGTSGVTNEQASTYQPINTTIHDAIKPFGYQTIATSIMNAAPRMALGLQQAPDQRDDAWRMYLGMPQQKNTFGISQYQPQTSADKNEIYYKINNFWNQLASGQKKSLYSSEMASQPPNTDYQTAITNLLAKQPANEDRTAWVMGRYKKGEGKDATGNYVSYYDKWDLDKNPVEGEYGRFGKPFEIYDRLYYDPEQKKIMWNPPTLKQGPPEARR